MVNPALVQSASLFPLAHLQSQSSGQLSEKSAPIPGISHINRQIPMNEANKVEEIPESDRILDVIMMHCRMIRINQFPVQYGGTVLIILGLCQSLFIFSWVRCVEVFCIQKLCCHCCTSLLLMIWTGELVLWGLFYSRRPWKKKKREKYWYIYSIKIPLMIPLTFIPFSIKTHFFWSRNEVIPAKPCKSESMVADLLLIGVIFL